MYGFKILCEISKVPFEISHKILNPYTAKYAFYGVLNFTIYDILRVMTSKVLVRQATGYQQLQKYWPTPYPDAHDSNLRANAQKLNL